MTKFAIAMALILAVVASVLGGKFRKERQARAELEREVVALRSSNLLHRAALQTRNAATDEQEERVNRMLEMVAEAAAKLNAANARYEELHRQQQAAAAAAASATAAVQQAAAARANSERQLAEFKAAIPPPHVTDTNFSGRTAKTYVFPELIGVGDRVLARDVEFADYYGRRFVFRRAEGAPLVFDIDQLHPGVLAHLSLDSQRIKAAAAEEEKRRDMAEAIHHQNVQAKRVAEQRAIFNQARIALEFAKIQEEARKVQSQEASELRALEAERIRAEATIQAANAAAQDPWRLLYPNHVFMYTNGNVNLVPNPAIPVQ